MFLKVAKIFSQTIKINKQANKQNQQKQINKQTKIINKKKTNKQPPQKNKQKPKTKIATKNMRDNLLPNTKPIEKTRWLVNCKFVTSKKNCSIVVNCFNNLKLPLTVFFSLFNKHLMERVYLKLITR